MNERTIDKLTYAVCEFVAHLDEACLIRVEGWKPHNLGLRLEIKDNEYVQVHPANWPAESSISCRVLPYLLGLRVEEARIMADHLFFSVSVKVESRTEPSYYAILVRGTKELLSEACSEIQKDLMDKD